VVASAIHPVSVNHRPVRAGEHKSTLYTPIALRMHGGVLVDAMRRHWRRRGPGTGKPFEGLYASPAAFPAHNSPNESLKTVDAVTVATVAKKPMHLFRVDRTATFHTNGPGPEAGRVLGEKASAKFVPTRAICFPLLRFGNSRFRRDNLPFQFSLSGGLLRTYRRLAQGAIGAEMLSCPDVLDVEGRVRKGGLRQPTILATMSGSRTYKITCG
jgi:hypothetical protein